MRSLCLRYRRAAGISKPFSPHALGGSLATNLLSKGAPLPFVERQPWHSRVETTMRYLHLRDEANRESYQSFLPDY